MSIEVNINHYHTIPATSCDVSLLCQVGQAFSLCVTIFINIPLKHCYLLKDYSKKRECR